MTLVLKKSVSALSNISLYDQHLTPVNHTSSKNSQIQKLLEKCHELLTYKEIVLCWIPSHEGIQWNEMVDKPAKNIAFIRTNFF